MHCPFCSTDETKVIDSRLVAEGAQVRRRRECLSCTERFTTYEVAELVLPRIIKQDGSREPFDEEKLRSGLLRALEKRPVSVESIEAVTRHAVPMRVGAGQDRRMGRERGRRCGCAGREAHPLGGQLIQRRRLHGGIPVAAQMVRARRVQRDQDDVSHLGTRWASVAGSENEQETRQHEPQVRPQPCGCLPP